ncbi:hypothetical protein PTTG_26109 [Puccinia triticina 1-1 BBBD Race 1]|uniref:Uncharacterized protein n=1 Tax=Puccinia triticina (isolate 1-1 / race 1 (BBBD)) TaxID=630390 RepID=A0A180GXP1_PUCT1|nr:hypothetical protein PTTG_26109 [Puccinia triticina 1-1 BBBD Race 1]
MQAGTTPAHSKPKLAVNPESQSLKARITSPTKDNAEKSTTAGTDPTQSVEDKVDNVALLLCRFAENQHYGS